MLLFKRSSLKRQKRFLWCAPLNPISAKATLVNSDTTRPIIGSWVVKTKSASVNYSTSDQTCKIPDDWDKHSNWLPIKVEGIVEACAWEDRVGITRSLLTRFWWSEKEILSCTLVRGSTKRSSKDQIPSLLYFYKSPTKLQLLLGLRVLHTSSNISKIPVGCFTRRSQCKAK